MELTVLADNNTFIDRYYLGEPGLSLLIKDGGTTVLFDTGYSGVFLKNAFKMGKDMRSIDYVVLSHSHLDHTWGLDPLIKYFSALYIEKRLFTQPVLVAHPQTFISVGDDAYKEVGSLLSEEKLKKHFPLRLSDRPLSLSSRLTFLGEIPRKNDFEGHLSFGRKQGSDDEDIVVDDSALVYKSDQGLVIITGCSHSGICNIVEYAKEVCGDDRIADIVGGFHLQSPSQRQLEGTLAYLKDAGPKQVHACHCTDLSSKIALSTVVPIRETGVGLALRYDG